MRLSVLIFNVFCLFLAVLASAQTVPAKTSVKDSFVAQDSVVDQEDTVFVVVDDGIPWNREFTPERLVRHDTFDPALKVAYSYSVSFVGGSFGSFAQQSYMAHLAYEFSPELHLYANLGLWMPLYSHFKMGAPIDREDVRQGRVDIILPDVELEYKPSENTSFRLMFVNERDAMKAYGPRGYYPGYCSAYRNSIFCR